MPSLISIIIAALVGGVAGSWVTWIMLRRSRQVSVKRLVANLISTDRELTSLRVRVENLEEFNQDPKQFQKRIIQGITEVAHRLADLDLNMSDSVSSGLPTSPFPGD